MDRENAENGPKVLRRNTTIRVRIGDKYLDWPQTCGVFCSMVVLVRSRMQESPPIREAFQYVRGDPGYSSMSLRVTVPSAKCNVTKYTPASMPAVSTVKRSRFTFRVRTKRLLMSNTS